VTKSVPLHSLSDWLLKHRAIVKTQSTTRRWVSTGVRGIKLPVWYAGGSPQVNIADLDQWFARVTEVKTARPLEQHEDAR
jgi:hypothetical protein